MNLFVLRHGTAVNSEFGVKDYDRKLSENGILQAVKIADYLKYFNIKQIICSSALRAFETASIVDEIIKTDSFLDFKDLYLTDSNHIKQTIIENASYDSVLYVGHNFGISDFVSELSGEPITMSTCMLVNFEVDIDHWNMLSNGIGIIKNIIEPNQL